MTTSSPPPARRLNVAINDDTVAAVNRLVATGITTTEAVRRLIGYGDYVHRAITELGHEVLIEDADGGRTRVVLLG